MHSYRRANLKKNRFPNTYGGRTFCFSDHFHNLLRTDCVPRNTHTINLRLRRPRTNFFWAHIFLLAAAHARSCRRLLPLKNSVRCWTSYFFKGSDVFSFQIGSDECNGNTNNRFPLIRAEAARIRRRSVRCGRSAFGAVGLRSGRRFFSLFFCNYGCSFDSSFFSVLCEPVLFSQRSVCQQQPALDFLPALLPELVRLLGLPMVRQVVLRCQNFVCLQPSYTKMFK